jgi:hypothetical protein
MADRFPSITAADINRAAALLDLYHDGLADYPADVKAELVEKIRGEVRAMQVEAPDLAPAATLMTTLVHPDVVAFVDKADRDWPEKSNRIFTYLADNSTAHVPDPGPGTTSLRWRGDIG